MRQAAERQVGDAGHRREHDPVRQRMVADPKRRAARFCLMINHLVVICLIYAQLCELRNV
jgi:hypothetical protein